ncbi:MAG: ATP-binding protein [Hymenobacteraceae bacterium]|nr:ATP-binding protein [Hymenobacteraceae bacterium]MDX5396013.1 ATP-binding protein [Hymenobacteraceae bacterium]MDX5442154.1 ATP-binding protein [Hymenobacteraceae bacterium]MDX5512074.1 ATP-binding protein [Hymenobacteraceae bacterium]
MNNTIRVNCTRENLKLIREFVEDYLDNFDLSDVVLNQMILAVDEICANLIIHSNNEDHTKFITLRIDHVEDEFMFEITDNGRSFVQANYKEPNIRENIKMGKKGGVGVALVNRIMDKVEFISSEDKNTCRLFKKVE